jgi:ubiquitin-activating enzyme E1
MAAEEITKFHGKFTASQGMFYFEPYTRMFPEGDSLKHEIDETSRYRDNIALFGRELQENLCKSKVFLVGAGALGCEYMKLFALQGFGCGAQGKIFLVDDDKIERSNLSRQFFFRDRDIGMDKSVVAGRAAKAINPEMNLETRVMRVGWETQQIFSDNFYQGLDFIVGGVDNIHARYEMDAKGVLHKKPFFDAGTNAHAANCQLMIPEVSVTYKESNPFVSQAGQSHPMCTLKSFPHNQAHCTAWSKEEFNTLFKEQPAKLSLETPKPTQDGEEKTAEEREAEEEIQELREVRAQPSVLRICGMAVSCFNRRFRDRIEDLLERHPRDQKDENGVLFWTAPKICPKPIEFDCNDPVSFAFVRGFFRAIAFAFGIEDKDSVTDAILMEALKGITGESRGLSDRVTKVLNLRLGENEEVKLLTFDKDNEADGHMDVVYSLANLRARNYSIPEEEKYQVKITAGSIIPAIATTTALICGLVNLEIIKHVLDLPINRRRGYQVNLGAASYESSFVSRLDPITSGAVVEEEEERFVRAIPEGKYRFMKDTIRIQDMSSLDRTRRSRI